MAARTSGGSAAAALWAVSRIRILRTPSAALVPVVGVVVTVLVLMYFLAMAHGFQHVFSSAGSDRIAVILGGQGTSEVASRLTQEQADLLRRAPGIAHDAAGPEVSAEASMTLSVAPPVAGAQRINATLRGLSQRGPPLRDGFRLVAGRLFTPGLSELVVGRALAEQMGVPPRRLVGKHLQLAGRDWTVVGIYALDSRVFESELWADVGEVQSLYERHDQYQSVRVRLDTPGSLAQLIAYVKQDPRLPVDVRTERQRLRADSNATTNIIVWLGWPIACLLAIGCSAGIMNALSMSLQGQQRSLRILYWIGYPAGAITCSILLEVLLLGLLGTTVGVGIAWLLFDQAHAETLGRGFKTVSYTMRVDSSSLLQAYAFGVVLVLAAALPAARRVFRIRP